MTSSIQIAHTARLEIAYEEYGQANGSPLVLLHGWPDSPRTWDSIIPALIDAGYRCFVPFLRGFGPTRFSNSSTMKSGQSTALASDLIEFANTLKLDSFYVAGHDWGAFACYLAAANWPNRIKKLIAVSVPYGINTPTKPPGLLQTKAFWYQWLFQTKQGRQMLTQDRNGFCRFIWETWMPRHQFDKQDFEAAASAWQNPDWIAITLHYYRNRWGAATDDPAYKDLEAIRLKPPIIRIPTLLIHGAEDPCILQKTTDGKEPFFSEDYQRQLLPRVGHFPQRESPQIVQSMMINFFTT